MLLTLGSILEAMMLVTDKNLGQRGSDYRIAHAANRPDAVLGCVPKPLLNDCRDTIVEQLSQLLFLVL